MPAKTIGECIDARCTRCGARNMQISEEFTGSSNYEVQAGKLSAITSANALQATGRLFGRCRQCSHDWVFRKNPLASQTSQRPTPCGFALPDSLQAQGEKA